MKLKYMSTADVRKFAKGERFGGQLAEPLAQDVVFDWENNHVVDTTDPQYAKVSEAAWELMARDWTIQDVTSDDIMPVSDGEAMWLARRDPNAPPIQRPQTSVPAPEGAYKVPEEPGQVVGELPANLHVPDAATEPDAPGAVDKARTAVLRTPTDA